MSGRPAPLRRPGSSGERRRGGGEQGEAARNDPTRTTRKTRTTRTTRDPVDPAAGQTVSTDAGSDSGSRYREEATGHRCPVTSDGGRPPRSDASEVRATCTRRPAIPSQILQMLLLSSLMNVASLWRGLTCLVELRQLGIYRPILTMMTHSTMGFKPSVSALFRNFSPPIRLISTKLCHSQFETNT